jgi:hypothetical protein
MTTPHHNAKNQSFLLVPFQFSQSKTKASTNKSNASKAKNTNTQIRKKLNTFISMNDYSSSMARLNTMKTTKIMHKKNIGSSIAC